MITAVRRKFNKLISKGKLASVLALWSVIAVGLLLSAVSLTRMNMTIDPTVYRPLLDLIARAESNGNYNAYFGEPHNSAIVFTSMSVNEVLQWQKEYVQQGSPSSAVGRYQFLNSTLSGLVTELGIHPDQKFDQSLQDRLAVALLERRGAREYIDDKLTREEFAANLAKEWAGLPKIVGENPEESYYASDGLNKSRVSVDEILAVIERVGA